MNLNKEQQKAVKHIQGPMLILAGAGSGKTRVVTHRIAYLIENGILPSDILAVTFTNKAASEMNERVKKITKSSVLTCTFHSLGARVLRESISHLGYKQDFTIYDQDDSLKLIRNCLNILGIKDEKGLAKELKGYISKAKNDLLTLTEITSNNSPSKKEKIFTDIYPLYQVKLKEYNALDFDDLLYLPVKLFKEHKSILEFYQNKWLFLLIDEYQDTNNAQYTLAKMLSAKHQNIFVVGDPDQSIYSWRGAKYQNILNFDKDFPNAITINLEQNYRSTETILSAANSLIKNNSERLEKDLWSNVGKGELITVNISETEKQEAYYVVNQLIKSQTNYNLSLNDIVIFYRTNSQSRIFEDALISKKLPYVIYGGLSFYQRKEIKDIIAFLKIVQSDSDFISFTRTINLPKRGIGPATIEKIISLAGETNSSIMVIIKAYLENPTHFPEVRLSKKQQSGLLDYLTLIYSVRDLVKNNLPFSEIISEIISKTNYLSLLKEDPDSYEDRKENLDALLAKANEYQENHEDATLTQFLEEISLLTSMDKTEKQESIKLMSIHNGKGLEFPLVFLVGMEEDIFPHINSKNSIEEIEEERRLCYVGITRAKQKLFLTASLYRYMWGAPKIMQPSRFLKEIPAKYLENQSIITNKQEIYTEEASHKEHTKKIDSDFNIGNQVIHKIFGIGIIKKVFNTSMGETYDVYFKNSNSIKTLVAKYAKLKKY